MYVSIHDAPSRKCFVLVHLVRRVEGTCGLWAEGWLEGWHCGWWCCHFED